MPGSGPAGHDLRQVAGGYLRTRSMEYQVWLPRAMNTITANVSG